LKNRLFISLNIPKDVIDQIITLRDSVSSGIKVKWEPKEKLHLTLKFIGDVDNRLLNQISNELQFVENYKSFNCAFTKFGFFYRNNIPSILWAGLETDNSLLSLIDDINKRLENLNIQSESKNFNAHITLLRIKNDLGLDFVNSFKNFTFKPLEFSSNSISLYKSELHRDGSKYFEIKNYKLK
jgi:RNA 2',3'-cyclic 3'-phosphodiesterase